MTPKINTKNEIIGEILVENILTYLTSNLYLKNTCLNIEINGVFILGDDAGLRGTSSSRKSWQRNCEWFKN